MLLFLSRNLFFHKKNLVKIKIIAHLYLIKSRPFTTTTIIIVLRYWQTHILIDKHKQMDRLSVQTFFNKKSMSCPCKYIVGLFVVSWPIILSNFFLILFIIFRLIAAFKLFLSFIFLNFHVLTKYIQHTHTRSINDFSFILSLSDCSTLNILVDNRCSKRMVEILWICKLCVYPIGH